jgi:integrase
MAVKKAAGRRGNGEGTIYQRPDGLWCAQITVGLKENGKPDRKSIYGKTRAIVVEKKKAAEAKVTTGLPLDRQNLTIETLMTEYLKDTSPTLRPKTIRSYTQLSNIHIVPHLGAVKVVKLDARQVQHWQATLIDSGLSGQSVNLARGCLSRALDMAVRYDWVSRNVVNYSKAPSVVHKPSPTMSQEDAQKILAAFAGHRLEGIVYLMVGCGLRISETLGLTWEDVDLENRELRVAHQLGRKSGGNSGEFVLATPKTKRGIRVLPIPPFVASALERQQLVQIEAVAEAARAEQKWGNNWQLVFTCGMGQPLAYRNVLRQFQLVIGRLELLDVTPHDMRHLHASLLAGQGINMKAISDSLGHSQIAITMDRYTHALRGADSGISGAIQNAVTHVPEKKPGSSLTKRG